MGRFLPKNTPENSDPSWSLRGDTSMPTTSKFEPRIV